MNVNETLDSLKNIKLEFPEIALSNAILLEDEITPHLMSLLDLAIEQESKIHANYMGHLYALFLLSQFKHQPAFEKLVTLITKPYQVIEHLLGDCVTEDLPKFLASTYDGNLEVMKSLIQNRNHYIWVRTSACVALVSIFKIGSIKRSELLLYFKQLLNSKFKGDNSEAVSTLISCLIDIHPKELYNDINQAFSEGRVDTNSVSMRQVDAAMKQDKQKVLDKRVYNNTKYGCVEDVIVEMKSWPCFSGEIRPLK